MSVPWPTLILPSVDTAAAFIERALTHLEAQRFPGEIIVTDRSPPQRLATLRGVVERHRALRILLLEHDAERHLLDRLADCAESCDSEFVAVHADDDFMFVPALAECATFLEAHPDYSAAKGRMLFFVPGGALASLSKHEGFSREEPNVATRLIRHVANFNSTFHAVHRRTQLIEALRTTLAHTTNVVFWQYLASSLTIVQGKLKVIERPYYYRFDNDAGWRSVLKQQRSLEHWPLLVLSPELPRLFETLMTALRDALARAGVRANAKLEENLQDACVWLVRRSLCRMLETESAEADSAFIRRAATTGTEENRLLEACVSLMRAA